MLALFRVLVAERLAAVTEARLHEQLAGHRRRPGHLREVEHREAVGHRGLGRDGWTAVVPDAPLVVVEDRQLVLRRQLRGEAQVHALLIDEEHAALRPVRIRQPLGRVAGIPVLVEAGHVALVLLPARREVEPQLVAHQRPAHRRVVVVRLLHLVRVRQPLRLEVVVDVGALPRRGDGGGEERSAHRVAALFRDDVDAEAAERLLGRHGRVVHRDFLRGPRVGHEVRELALPTARCRRGRRRAAGACRPACCRGSRTWCSAGCWCRPRPAARRGQAGSRPGPESAPPC